MLNLRSLIIGILVGLYLGWILFARQQENARLSPAPARAIQAHKPTPQVKDPLIDIEGIGPAYEADLNALGIMTFTQLAKQDAEQLASRMSARITAERIRLERWIEQAQARAK